MYCTHNSMIFREGRLFFKFSKDSVVLQLTQEMRKFTNSHLFSCAYACIKRLLAC